MRTTLLNRWIKLFPNASLDRSLQIFDKLWQLYAQPTRRYHTIAHIAASLATLDKYFPNADRSVELAIWFHDAIYIAGDPDNELLSGSFSELCLTYLHEPQAVRAEVRQMIECTKHHIGQTQNEDILCDIDLEPLSLPSIEYDHNTAELRFEYRAYGDTIWHAGRLSFIDKLLERSAIFQTDGMREWFEANARGNLKRERKLYTS
jgi:predicted metal-dependent HD superfamily phosphohydrolase